MAYTLDDVQKYVDKEGLKDNIPLYYKPRMGRILHSIYHEDGEVREHKQPGFGATFISSDELSIEDAAAENFDAVANYEPGVNYYTGYR